MENQTKIDWTKILRFSMVFLIAIVMGLSLYHCNSPRTENKGKLTKESEIERNVLRNDLLALRHDIDREIDKVGIRLKDSSIETRELLIKADRKLKSNQAKINKALDDMEKASENTWKDVKQVARKTNREVKTSCRQLAYDVEGIFAP